MPEQSVFGACLRVSIAVRRHHNHGNSYKRKQLMKVVASNFRGLVHYHHTGERGGWESGSAQADTVLEKPTS